MFAEISAAPAAEARTTRLLRVHTNTVPPSVWCTLWHSTNGFPSVASPAQQGISTMKAFLDVYSQKYSEVVRTHSRASTKITLMHALKAFVVFTFLPLFILSVIHYIHLVL